MGIRVAERLDVFCVPYGTRNDEGTPEVRFIDLKSHPEWIPVLPSCVGWPETRTLLETINAVESPLMSLAADQAFTTVEDAERPSVLTSFVTLCFAHVPSNSRLALQHLAGHLASRLDKRLQQITDLVEKPLHVDALFEIQPTVFRLGTQPRASRVVNLLSGSREAGHGEGGSGGASGWSLTIAFAASGVHQGEAREVWGLAVAALKEALGGAPDGTV